MRATFHVVVNNERESLVVQDRQRLEFSSFEQFEAGSAAGAQMRDLAREPHLLNGCRAVAATDNADR